MNVDDQEYEEFLKAEFNSNASNRKGDASGSKSNPFKNGKLSDGGASKLSKKEQQNLIDELAFPRASSENLDLDNCERAPVQDEKGWQNLWNQTQLEIQELEMRANAIKAMMEKSKGKGTDQKAGGQLLDNIESEEDEFLSDGEYKNESEPSRDSEPRRSRSKSHKSDLDKEEKRLKSDDRRRSKSRENRKEKGGKGVEEARRSRSRSKNKISKTERTDKERSERWPRGKERRSKSKEKPSEGREKLAMNESADEGQQIREAVEGEFLDIKVDQRKRTERDRADKKSKKASTKPDVSRLSMESGEIMDDDSDDELSRTIEAKKTRRARSPSVTSSIDSFGRNRRRKRRSYSPARRRSHESGSLSSLDEILREAELEEQHSGGYGLRSEFGQKPASKSHPHYHHLHHKSHHHRPKKQRPSYVDLDEPKQEAVSEEGETA